MCLLTGRGVATMISQHDAEVKDASAPPCRSRATDGSLLRQTSAARSDEPKRTKPTESSLGFRERRVSPGARPSPCRSTEARGRLRRSTRDELCKRRTGASPAVQRPRTTVTFWSRGHSFTKSSRPATRSETRTSFGSDRPAHDLRLDLPSLLGKVDQHDITHHRAAARGTPSPSGEGIWVRNRNAVLCRAALMQPGPRRPPTCAPRSTRPSARERVPP